MEHEVSRRAFVAAAATVAISCRRETRQSAAALLPSTAGPLILFQGDSITDAGRDAAADETTSPSLGFGYALLIAAALLSSHLKAEMRFANRGVSGNRSCDLLRRWSLDTLALRPSVLSILIGVNDYTHRRAGFYHGTPADLERACDQMLESTRTALPTAKIILIEPFLLRAGAVDSSWVSEFTQYRAAVERSGARAKATWVPMQERFNELSRERPPDYWARDGVHPTLAGHAIIAEQWQVANAM